ncbi:MAG: tetratricopeptide repeat protein [Hyphomicrobiaceae bacterium]
MQTDRYGNALSTSSAAARDAYIEGVDLVLSGNYGAEHAFQRAVDADEAFALGFAGLARAEQVMARGPAARSAMDKALELANSGDLTDRERGHIAAMNLLISGKGAAALEAMRTNALDHPRDALVVQPCTSVFGLIGFSGLPGREAEQLAFLNGLAPHYGDDWWFNTAHAFAQCETGQVGQSIDTIERSLAGNPDSAHGAHVRAHIYYENGETEAGYKYMSGWRDSYDRRAPLMCHISWHVALWALERGETERAWQVIDDCVRPAKASGPPLNILTDTASFLMRSELAGEARRADLWHEVSDYAQKMFPNPGIAFADVHAALAHAVAGESDALEKVVKDAKGPARDLVSKMSEAFRAFAAQSWAEAIALLTPAMSDHERIGGSRAQRDLLEFMYLGALLRLDRTDEAQRLLMMRRPMKADAHAVAGL